MIWRIVLIPLALMAAGALWFITKAEDLHDDWN